MNIVQSIFPSFVKNESTFFSNQFAAGVLVGSASVILFLFLKNAYAPKSPAVKYGMDNKKLYIEYTGGLASEASKEVKQQMTKAIQLFCQANQINLTHDLPETIPPVHSEFTTDRNSGLFRHLPFGKKIELRLNQKTQHYSIRIDFVSDGVKKDCIGKINKFRAVFGLKSNFFSEQVQSVKSAVNTYNPFTKKGDSGSPKEKKAQ